MKNHTPQSFIKAGMDIYPLSAVERLDTSRLEGGVATLYVAGRQIELSDFDAFEAVLLLKPGALEGRRFRWVRHVWAFHNLVAHPVMQILVWLGFRRAGLWIHDVTVPRPVGIRNPS